MPNIFVDFNRGSDSNTGLDKFNALKNVPSNPNPGAGNGVYFASDSVWTLNPTKAAAAFKGFFRNGTSGSRITLGAYDYAGSTGTKPTFQYQMIPVASDWTWDATILNGAPKGWYIQFAYSALAGNVYVKVGSRYAGVVLIEGLVTGINTTQNNVTPDTLRYCADRGTSNHRLYLSGGGVQNSSVIDPSTYFGTNAITVGFGSFFYLFESGAYVTFDGLQVQNGGGLLTVDGTAADLNLQGLIVRNCKSIDTNNFMEHVCSASGSPLLEFQAYSNTHINLGASAYHTNGAGVTGDIYGNTLTNGNLCFSNGGMYIQSSAPTGVRGLYIRDNVFRQFRNASGSLTFDGCGLYEDVGANNNVYTRNIVYDSFRAYQINGGRTSSWIANQAINCDQMIVGSDSAVVQNTNYLIAQNLHITSNGCNQFYRGTQAAISNGQTPSITGYADGGSMVAAKIYNNVIVPTGDCSALTPIMAYDLANAAKVDVRNNYGVGWNAKFVMNTSYTDITAGKGSITTGSPSFYSALTGDYRLATNSQLIGAGYSGLAANTEDFKRRQYNTPPAIGPYEKDPYVSMGGMLIAK